MKPPQQPARIAPATELTPPTRWVFADVAEAILDAPPDSWPWTLYRPDGTPQTFATPAELREAVAR